MFLSGPLTRLILGLAVVMPMLGGCDRQSGQSAQPQASTASSNSPASQSAEPLPGIDRSHKGTPLPDLTFRDAGGHSLHLAAQTGQPLLINLWATWCAPCVAELPTLDHLAAARGGTLKVITLSQDMGGGADVAAFLAAKHLTHLPPWLDPQSAAAASYGLATLPASIYYDAQGHELWRWTGGNDWTSPAAGRLLGEAGGT